ncbi:MAG: hypothetical protein ABSH15_03005 [Verrucomicrobiota bacterium]|jgi:hypothetical protein
MNGNKQSPIKNGTTAPNQPDKTSSWLAFSLVVIMLVILLVIIWLLLLLPSQFQAGDTRLEYYKQALSVLLGAFGAWIGAGAAYFFGRENLNESSRSTEAALRIQQEGLRGPPRFERIKDLTLTAMNKDFMFGSDKTYHDVTEGFKTHKDYWFVPVLDKAGNGTMEDIIHARVFWQNTFNDTEPLSQIISDIDNKAALSDFKELHGPSFFVTVSLDDKIARVYDQMDQKGAVVGIVVDENEKPTYCFTKIELQNVLAAQK